MDPTEGLTHPQFRADWVEEGTPARVALDCLDGVERKRQQLVALVKDDDERQVADLASSAVLDLVRAGVYALLDIAAAQAD